ncbi:histidine phosphatase family protein [Pseudomonas sp. NPDC087612]|uniref:lipopolysaccharide core heptose(II)-phosphate phosphatase PmrG n=1 Tax=unclassified Pseudomonas TaxID=196821 RepID=UPI0018A7AE44|nr:MULTISPECIES: histidine phosphatase family protein [unclassified Pseudomonas]QPG63810.1 histidine phosphatase family protein [Pseudomonas sp. BIGb0427]UVM55286.1 histidine phosphatase family protein [Pseudomonas sp. B21-012]UVM66260.1 histidine phosphatase family protein [Pseudomonas sp. B21-009]
MSSSHLTPALTASTATQRRRGAPWRQPLTGLGLLLALVILALWWTSRTPIVDLGSDNQMHNSGVYSEWAKGAVIVLIRHAERCDRSHNRCLGDPSGITLEGSQAASDVGNGIQRLGLNNAQVLSSPEVRTQQTAHFMFGKAIASEDWLKQCDKGFADAAFKHKRADHNLVLVTHSGCIDHLERQLNVPGGERSSAYASALFVSMGSNGKARILGQMNANEWRKLVASAGM